MEYCYAVTVITVGKSRIWVTLLLNAIAYQRKISIHFLPLSAGLSATFHRIDMNQYESYFFPFPGMWIFNDFDSVIQTPCKYANAGSTIYRAKCPEQYLDATAVPGSKRGIIPFPIIISQKKSWKVSSNDYEMGCLLLYFSLFFQTKSEN